MNDNSCHITYHRHSDDFVGINSFFNWFNCIAVMRISQVTVTLIMNLMGWIHTNRWYNWSVEIPRYCFLKLNYLLSVVTMDNESISTTSPSLSILYFLLSSYSIINTIMIWSLIGVTICFSLFYSLHPHRSGNGRYQIATLSGSGG